VQEKRLYLQYNTKCTIHMTNTMNVQTLTTNILHVRAHQH